MVKLHFFAESYDDRYQFAVYTRQVSSVLNNNKKKVHSPNRGASVNRYIALSADARPLGTTTATGRTIRTPSSALSSPKRTTHDTWVK